MILLSSSLTFGTTDNMCQSSVLVKRQEIFRDEGHVAGEGDQGPEVWSGFQIIFIMNKDTFSVRQRGLRLSCIHLPFICLLALKFSGFIKPWRLRLRIVLWKKENCRDLNCQYCQLVYLFPKSRPHLLETVLQSPCVLYTPNDVIVWWI